MHITYSSSAAHAMKYFWKFKAKQNYWREISFKCHFRSRRFESKMSSKGKESLSMNRNIVKPQIYLNLSATISKMSTSLVRLCSRHFRNDLVCSTNKFSVWTIFRKYASVYFMKNSNRIPGLVELFEFVLHTNTLHCIRLHNLQCTMNTLNILINI